MPYLLTIRPIDHEDFVEVLADGQSLGGLLDEAIARAAPGENWGDVSLPWRLVDRGRPFTTFDASVLVNGAEAAILFVCDCGHAACSSVATRVIVSEDRIILDRVQAHRVCLIDHPPIEFEREQFLGEVRKAKARMASSGR